MSKAVWGSALRLCAVISIGFAAASCGTIAREGTASSFLIVKALEGASGATPSEFGSTLSSDAVSIVKTVPTIYGDAGRAQFVLALKDPGSPESPAAPSPSHWITLDPRPVRSTRPDGRNVAAAGRPYAYDGGITGTVTTEDTSVGFLSVRPQANMEAPLAALAGSAIVVS